MGTGSLRRQAQLRHHRGDLVMVEIRGNVDTRLAKLDRRRIHAIVLAKAGLRRLGSDARITELLPPEVCLPAAGQGAIGIETRALDAEVTSAVSCLNHSDTWVAVESERAALAGLEGGCQVPIGAWARIGGSELVLDAAVFASDGSSSLRASGAAPTNQGRELGRKVAQELLDRFQMCARAVDTRLIHHVCDVQISRPRARSQGCRLDDHTPSNLVDASGVGELKMMDPAVHAIDHEIDPLAHFVARQSLANDAADDRLGRIAPMDGYWLAPRSPARP